MPASPARQRLAAEAPRQIANAHTVFNVVNTILFLPFAGYIAKLVEKLVPIKELTFEEKAVAKFSRVISMKACWTPLRWR